MTTTRRSRLSPEAAAGGLDVAAALERLSAGPMNGIADLGYARVDTHRGLRTGDPEVVYAAGKTVEQTVAILRALAGQPGSRPAVATRLTPDASDAVRAEFPDAVVDEVAGAAAVGPLPEPRGRGCVVAGRPAHGPGAAEGGLV